MAGDIATVSDGVGVCGGGDGGGEQGGWTVKDINERVARRCGVRGSFKDLAEKTFTRMMFQKSNH